MVKESVYKLDKMDRTILNMLSMNSRTPLRKIAHEVNLSIDSVHKRIKKMRAAEIFYPIISLVPKNFGYPFSAQITMNFKNASLGDVNKFAAFLRSHPNVIYAISTSGKSDFFIVVIGRDSGELEEIMLEIREKYKDIITNWSSNIVLKIYKYEYYDLLGLK